MSPLTPRRFRNGIALGLGALALSALVGLSIGSEPVTLADAFSGDEAVLALLFDLRLPRVLAAVFVGGALAACGAAFQGLMRNALASPFVLGVSGGGSLGAVIAIVAGADTVAVLGTTVSTRPLFAFAGCLTALAAIWAIASRRGRLVPQTLLLAGVVVNAFFLAVLGFMNYVATPHQSKEILRWLMGGLSYGQSLGTVLVSGAMGVVGVLWLMSMGRLLNVLTLGTEAATRLGVAVVRTRRTVFVVASILTGGAVALAGPVGFVGLFVPHGVRLVFGPDHRFLLPGSFLAGGAFLVLADAFARLISGPSEMPVGLITAAVGAPCFILILIRVPSYGEEAA